MQENKKSIRQIEEDYRSSAQQFFTESKEDEEFADGNQWTSEEIADLQSQAQYPIVVNVIKPAIEQGVAMLTAQKPRFSATARDDSDAKVAKAFSDLMAYVWNISNGNVELKQSIYDYYKRGLGYMMAYVDPYADFGKGEVFVKSLDTYEVLVDPSAKKRDFSDAAHIIVTQVLTKSEIKFRYPDFKDWDNAVREDDDGLPTGSMYNMANITRAGTNAYQEDRYKVADAYTKIKTTATRVFNPQYGNERVLDDKQYEEYLRETMFFAVTGGSSNPITDPKEVDDMKELYEQTGGVFHQMIDPQSGQPTIVPGPDDGRGIPDSTVVLQKVTVQDMIEMGVLSVSTVPVNRIRRELFIGWAPYKKLVMNIDSYPIIPLVHGHQRNPYPVSPSRDSKDLQRYINKLRSLMIAHASSSTNIKLLIPRGSTNKKQLEAEWGKSGTAVIEFDAELGKPEFGAPVPLPNELYKNEADAKKDIEFLFGIFALQHGDSSQAPETYKGTVALEQMGQRRMQSKQADIEYAINKLASIVVQLMQDTYTHEKVVRILRPNNISTETRINQPVFDDVTGFLIGKVNDITVGKYDVILVSGSTLPSNRWARMEYYMSLYEKGIIDQVEVLKQTEVADMEGVLERASIISQLQAQVEQLSQQVKDLTGDAQTKDREISHMQKRVELEKFKADLSDKGSRAESALTIYQTRLNDDIKNQKAENKQSNKE